MANYSYTKHIEKLGAFEEYVKNNFVNYDWYSYSNDLVVVASKVVLSAEEEAGLAALVGAYVDPVHWLVLNKTESNCTNSDPSNSATPIVHQSFIMSPNIDNIVVDSMKIVVQYDGTPSDFSGFDAATEAPTLTLELYDLTRGISITSVSVDLRPIALAWKAGEASPKWKTTQFYGLMEKITGYDCIWQVKGSISDPRITYRLNCMQKIYYESN